MPTTTPVRRLVSVAAAATRYDVHPRTLRRRISDGTLTAYRIGRLLKVDLIEADAALLTPIPTAAAS